MGVFNDNITSETNLEVVKDWMDDTIRHIVDDLVTNERTKIDMYGLPMCQSNDIIKRYLWSELTTIWVKNKHFFIEKGLFGETRTNICDSLHNGYMYDVCVDVFLDENECIPLIKIPIIDRIQYILITQTV